MTIANYHGSLIAGRYAAASEAKATEWVEMNRFNYFRKFRLIDGSSYRGTARLMQRRSAEGRYEYRKLTAPEINDIRRFEQEW